MAELIDIEAPFLPVPALAESASTFWWWILPALMMFGLIWLLRSRSFRHWRRLLAWRSEDGVWVLFYLLQPLKRNNSLLNPSLRERLQMVLQQLGTLGSQSQTLTPAQKVELDRLGGVARRLYWRCLWSTYFGRQKVRLKHGLRHFSLKARSERQDG
ncbi:hypothetical protein [Thiomicrorhabdus xiamenensis]|uniref:Uncharacterized protein n=1 Tax=Thiomicrorhabdus xiamenensis TaxID=2739063 RepID=A0A7D4TEQ9_9GAMM|nr:hypothetical protein [Thiomicrorhabdus xiamenensis]QKI88168.1 hypothetical protein HQN79_00565 [Thiomicrorhabdus xiamenensis]